MRYNLQRKVKLSIARYFKTNLPGRKYTTKKENKKMLQIK